MEYQIKSHNLVVKINSKGAELSSVKLEDLEYLWQAKADVWPRHAPVLFPIVGRLKDNSISQHGFARDKELKLAFKDENEISFELINDEETNELFPFDFKLIIWYSITDNRVVCGYEVVNTASQKNLFFSIGAHPGFKVPLSNTEKFEDYKLVFSNKEYYTTVLADGLLSDTKKELVLHHGELNLSTALFENDALVFEDSQIDQIRLISKSGKGLELNCKDWPYFGIWSKKGCSEFVCLEPWYGIADSINSTGNLQTKKGIIELKVGEKFDCSFSIRVF